MPFYYGGCEGIRKHLVEGLIRFCFQEMGTSTTAKRSARRLVPKNSSRPTFANCPKRLGLALTWLSGTTLTSRWEPARDSSLVDVKVTLVSSSYISLSPDLIWIVLDVCCAR